MLVKVHRKLQNGSDGPLYKTVFSGRVGAKDLEDLSRELEKEPLPLTYQGEPMKPGDVVEICGETPVAVGRISYLPDEGAYAVTFTDAQRFELEVQICRNDGTDYHAEDLRGKGISWPACGFYEKREEGLYPTNVRQDSILEQDGLRVVLLEPGQPAVETRVLDDLHHWQLAVSDHGEDALMEVSYPFDEDVIAVGNEEAKLIGMEPNRHLGCGLYAGPVYLVGDDGEGGFRDLRDEECDRFCHAYAVPEVIDQRECEKELFHFLAF